MAPFQEGFGGSMDVSMNARSRAVALIALTGALVAPIAGIATAQDAKPAQQAPAAGGTAGTAWSAEVAPNGTTGIALDAAQMDIVKKVGAYFDSLDALQGKFVQTGADGKVMKGKFAMKKPGKFRFDYARPSLQVIISDGKYLAIQDRDLNNEDRVELDQTPFRMLLRKDVDLVRDARIVEVQDAGDTITLGIQDKDPNTPGRIRLVFSTKPAFELKEWLTKDAQGLDTRVEVGELQKGGEIDAKEFVIKPMGAAFNNQ